MACLAAWLSAERPALRAGGGYRAASLDAPTADDGLSVGDGIGETDDGFDLIDARHDVQRGLAGLRPRERQDHITRHRAIGQL